jgi:hypothetical protein
MVFQDRPPQPPYHTEGGRWLLLVTVTLFLISPTIATTLILQTSGNQDGYSIRSAANQTFYALRNGIGTNAAGNSNNAITEIASDRLTNNYSAVSRGEFMFNSSTLPANAVIDDVTLSLYSNQLLTQLGTINYGIVGFRPKINGTVSKEDYQNMTFIRYSSDAVNPANNVWMNFSLNAAGKANVTKGWVNIAFLSQQDIDNTTTGLTWVYSGVRYSRDTPYSSEFGSFTPTLTIIYHLPVSTTPTPSSIYQPRSPPEDLTGLILTCSVICIIGYVLFAPRKK